MRLSPESALGSLEFMLRRAADSTRNSRDRTDDHQKLFLILAELLPTETLHDNIDIVLNILRQCLSSKEIKASTSALHILNVLLGTTFTEKDIPKIISK